MSPKAKKFQTTLSKIPNLRENLDSINDDNQKSLYM